MNKEQMCEVLTKEYQKLLLLVDDCVEEFGHADVDTRRVKAKLAEFEHVVCLIGMEDILIPDEY